MLGGSTSSYHLLGIRLILLEQAGQESYKALTRQYYRDADGCLVVFGACCLCVSEIGVESPLIY